MLITSWPAEFDFLSDLSPVLRIGEDYRGRPSVGGLNVAFASSSARLSIDPSSHLTPVAPQLWAYDSDNQVRRKSLHQVAPVYEAQEKKRPREGAVILYVGGGGGNRTRRFPRAKRPLSPVRLLPYHQCYHPAAPIDALSARLGAGKGRTSYWVRQLASH